MNNLDSMLKRNKDFAAQQSAAGALSPRFRGRCRMLRRSSSVALICVWIRLMYLELNRARPP